jgi:hypothetical protein
MYIKCSQADECGEPCLFKGDVDHTTQNNMIRNIINLSGDFRFLCERIGLEPVTLLEAPGNKRGEGNCEDIW